jgi:hypothetical protein
MMKVLFKKISLLLFLSVASLHCGRQEPSSSHLAAAVDVAGVRQAYAIVNAINYLPFSNAMDGCFARAFYMTMELTAQGLPSSMQYISAKTGVLAPGSFVRWNYHVAPMLWIHGDLDPTIIDPSLAPWPVMRSEWISLANPTALYDLYWAHGSQLQHIRDFDNEGPFAISDLIANFDDLDLYEEADITYACALMKVDIQNEIGLTFEQREQKVQRLLSRTQYLHGALISQGKLQTQTPAGQVSCL